jgi:hypothetical protein
MSFGFPSPKSFPDTRFTYPLYGLQYRVVDDERTNTLPEKRQVEFTKKTISAQLAGGPPDLLCQC